MREGSPTILCLASYFKGPAFIEECRRLGCRVLLVTREKYARENWPWESIEEAFFMPDLSRQPDIIHAVSYLARTRHIDRIVPLDDYDVEIAAALREHLRIPGMGETTARHFRDKLAMRVQARDKGVQVPDFVHVLNYDRLREFMEQTPPPWVLKPRSEAAAAGIRKYSSPGEVWAAIEEFGDRQSYYLLERFIPGDVYHVDSIVSEGEVLFSVVHQYGQPPLAVTAEGGIFATRTVPPSTLEAQALQSLNREVLSAMRMVRGVTHAEFIHSREDGEFYFLEVAARVGGANIDQMIEFATGVNLWREWARIEVAHFRGEPYRLPERRHEYAGLIISLARQESPDLSAYSDREVVWRMEKHHHAGLIVLSPDPQRVHQLLEQYSRRFEADFLAVGPRLEKPVD